MLKNVLTEEVICDIFMEIRFPDFNERRIKMDYQEGYVDGLAGAGMQYRSWSIPNNGSYVDGFILGSLDRKEMLKNNS